MGEYGISTEGTLYGKKSWSLKKRQELRALLPFSSHGTHEIVGPAFRLGEDESLVFFLLHDFLHQLRQLPVLLVLRAHVRDLEEKKDQ